MTVMRAAFERASLLQAKCWMVSELEPMGRRMVHRRFESGREAREYVSGLESEGKGTGPRVLVRPEMRVMPLVRVR